MGVRERMAKIDLLSLCRDFENGTERKKQTIGARLGGSRELWAYFVESLPNAALRPDLEECHRILVAPKNSPYIVPDAHTDQEAFQRIIASVAVAMRAYSLANSSEPAASFDDLRLAAFRATFPSDPIASLYDGSSATVPVPAITSAEAYVDAAFDNLVLAAHNADASAIASARLTALRLMGGRPTSFRVQAPILTVRSESIGEVLTLAVETIGGGSGNLLRDPEMLVRFDPKWRDALSAVWERYREDFAGRDVLWRVSSESGEITNSLGGESAQAAFETALRLLRSRRRYDRRIAISATSPDGIRLGTVNGIATKAGGEAGPKLIAARANEKINKVIVSNADFHTLSPSTVERLQAEGLTVSDVATIEDAELTVTAAIPRNFSRPDNRSFFGRKREIEEIETLLTKEGVVTILGAGGSGKTALMREVGLHLADPGNEAGYLSYPDGVCFASFVGVKEKTGIYREIFRGLSELDDQIVTTSRPSLESLRSIAAKRRMVMLLDNCELVASHVLAVVEDLREHCPNIRFVLTTRVAQNHRWGRVLALEPLSPPDLGALENIYDGTAFLVTRSGGQVEIRQTPASDPDDDIEIRSALSNEALLLFLEAILSSSDKRYRVAPDADDLILRKCDVVAAGVICQLADGIPLAIRLFAGNNHTSFEERARSFRHSKPQKVSKKALEVDGRQETMAHCISWSHQGLNAEEQALFRRLALFTGGWAEDDYPSICSLHDEEFGEAFQKLCNSSLIEPAGVPGFYRMLEPIRNFAERRLDETGETPEIKRKLVSWLKSRIQFDDIWLIGSADEEVIANTRPYIRTLESLLEAESPEDDALEAELHATTIHFRDGDGLIGLKYLDKVRLDRFTKVPVGVEMNYYLSKSVYSFLTSKYEETIDYAQRGLAAALQAGHKKNVALAHSGLGISEAYVDPPRLDNAEKNVTIGLRLALDTGDDWTVGLALFCKGGWHWQKGDNQGAIDVYTQALDRFKHTKDKMLLAYGKNSLAHLLRKGGDPSAASRLYLENLDWGSGLFPSKRVLAGCVLGACGVAVALGDDERAIVFFAAAMRQYALINAGRIPPIENDYRRDITAVKARMNPNDIERFTLRGERFSLTAATKEARKYFASCASRPG